MKLSVSREVAERVVEINEEINKANANASAIHKDDPFELLVIAQTEEMNKKMIEFRDFSTRIIHTLAIRNPLDAKILGLARGKTVADKKRELLKIINNNPALATSYKPLLYQRLLFYRFKRTALSKYQLPETPIREALEQFGENNQVQQEQQEVPQEEPQDDDFLK